MNSQIITGEFARIDKCIWVQYTRHMYIPRLLLKEIIHKFTTNPKVIILLGPRQVGKTTLTKTIVSELGLKTLILNGETTSAQESLQTTDIRALKNLIEGYEMLVIDEAQKIVNIGLTLKILYDTFPHIKYLVTGSSSFELNEKVSEPLTGRNWRYLLSPISVGELRLMHTPHEVDTLLEDLLLYGSYPEIFRYENISEKIQYLKQIQDEYLYRDTLSLGNIKHSEKVHSLLRLLAFQIGSPVSYTELSTQLGMSQETVKSYIDILEKCFIVYRLGGYKKNLRTEVTRQPKIYFTDLGIRNSIIDQFQPLRERNDVGALWENFLINERIKKNQYSNTHRGTYFWRVYTGGEIDYLEDYDGAPHPYEFKWSEKKSISIPTWQREYASTITQISRSNYQEFVV